MSKRNGEWLLAVVVMCCLVPAASAGDRDQHRYCDLHPRECAKTSVPEGGSSSIYLLGAGLTCFGAMFLRSKLAKPMQS
jgi:hypothetical protein